MNDKVFTQFVQTVLQDRIKNAVVSVRLGHARDKHRRFDTDHDGFNIIFVIDPVYLHDPHEIERIWEGLKKWVRGWNRVDRRLVLSADELSLVEETSEGYVDWGVWRDED